MNNGILIRGKKGKTKRFVKYNKSYKKYKWWTVINERILLKEHLCHTCQLFLYQEERNICDSIQMIHGQRINHSMGYDGDILLESLLWFFFKVSTVLGQVDCFKEYTYHVSEYHENK